MNNEELWLKLHRQRPWAFLINSILEIYSLYHTQKQKIPTDEQCHPRGNIPLQTQNYLI